MLKNSYNLLGSQVFHYTTTQNADAETRPGIWLSAHQPAFLAGVLDINSLFRLVEFKRREEVCKEKT